MSEKHLPSGGAAFELRRADAHRSPRRSTRRRSKDRRGVLLLVILSLLVIFLMTGVAFVVLARHYYDQTKSTAKKEENRIDESEPADLLDAALYDILRDTTNPWSRVRYHSLLRDLYGADGFVGQAFNPDTSHLAFQHVIPKFAGADPQNLLGPTGGQIVQFAIDPKTTAVADLFGNPHTLSQLQGYYNGRVLTWLSGPAKGQSARIVGYDYKPGIDLALVRVLEFHRNDGHGLTPATQAQSARSPEIQELVGHRFVVNGAPLNGTGFGYNRLPGADPLLTTNEDLKLQSGDPSFAKPLALMPNAAFLAPVAPWESVDPSSPQNHRIDLRYFFTDTELADPGFNSANQQDRQRIVRQRAAALGPAGLYGSDESYDAADYQNMLLALLPTEPQLPLDGSNVNPYSPTNLDNIIQPSLHRRALITHWLSQPGSGGGSNLWVDDNGIQVAAWNRTPEELNALGSPIEREDFALARRAVLRPLPIDHPNFPRLDSLVHGPWDIDNDGDGVPDSIWVDLGYPIMKTADGRRYKPMFAILCQDMDGKLNLNVHGSREDARLRANADPANGRPLTEREVVLAGGVSSSEWRPAGQGYGPAEISLNSLFFSDPTAQYNEYNNLLRGWDRSGAADGNYLPEDLNNDDIPDILGRYGADMYPGWDGILGMQDDVDDVPRPLRPLQWDGRAQMRLFNYPITYRPGTLRRGFLTPPDLKGWFGIGVDFSGQPNFLGFDHRRWLAGGAIERLTVETPYEIDVFDDGSYGPSATAADALFTVHELERLLRGHDADASRLPDRLLKLAPRTFDILINRRRVTTHSFDLPVPSVGLTEDLRDRLTDRTEMAKQALDAFPAELQDLRDRLVTGSNLTFSDLVLIRMLDELPATFTTETDANKISMIGERLRSISILLAPDLTDGLRMDVNRPFGDGRDNDGDGAVDEPGEPEDIQNLVPRISDSDSIEAADVAGDWTNAAYGLDLAVRGNFDAAHGNHPSLARQFYARHLFVLAMTLIDKEFLEDGFPKAGGGNLTEMQSVRRLAQWAVNVADFRDPDAIMTGFEVDLQPFVDNDNDPSNGTWDVDGDLTTSEGTFRVVLWGCERPHLLLTETLAFHDLRCVDSMHDVSGKKHYEDPYDVADDDNDLDQYRVPQGSAFFELFCVGNPSNAVMPQELYRYDDNGTPGDPSDDRWMLKLGRSDPSNPNSDPIWRLAISEQHDEWDESVVGRLSDENGGYNATNHRPEVTTFQPKAMEIGNNGQATQTVAIDRYVSFSRRRPSGPTGDSTFWNPTNIPAEVPVGQYAVVGPRDDTYVGSRPDPADPVNRHLDARHLIELRPARVTVDDDVHPPHTFVPDFLANGNVKPVVGIITDMPIDTTLNAGWAADPDRVGVNNVSEPLASRAGYYPSVSTTGGVDDKYGQLDGSVGQMLNEPVDLRGGRPIEDLANQIAQNPVGTHLNYRTVFLQRLADPTLRWNPEPGQPGHDADRPVNPYLTVDWQPLDLTVFNGEEPQPSLTNGPLSEISDTYVGWSFEPNYEFPHKFASRERGARESLSERNIWKAWRPFNKNGVGSGGNGRSKRDLEDSQPDHVDSFFKHNLVHTLGYLNGGEPNRVYGIPIDFLLPPFNGPPFTDLPIGLQDDAKLRHRGAPRTPFPWLTWNDRPFVNERELMLVPMSSPGRLTVEHTGLADNNVVPYKPEEEADDDRITNPLATYAHLLNFQDAIPDGAQIPLHIYRLFDYLGVRSRFAATEKVFNPAHFATGNGVDDGTQFRRPPFNRVSAYREPGRINLNTIVDPVVYDALFQNGGLLHARPPVKRAAVSRRGYGDENDDVYSFDQDIPTFFANVYRAANAGDLVPPQIGKQAGVNCTLDRQEPGGSKLFFRTTSTQPFDNINRNPYFRYESAQRLTNLVTTRSNVYAVWITVGFFEVQDLQGGDPISAQIIGRYGANLLQAQQNETFRRIYPESAMLGRELGLDTGEVRRHRMFAIIDRSIPVGFQPGKNLNVDQAILLKRKID